MNVFNCFECIIIRYLNIDLNGDQIYRKHLCIENCMIYLHPLPLNFESIHIFRKKSVSGARQIDFIYKISNEWPRCLACECRSWRLFNWFFPWILLQGSRIFGIMPNILLNGHIFIEFIRFFLISNANLRIVNSLLFALNDI